MDAIHANGLKPKSKKNVEEFSKQVDKIVNFESEAAFCRDIFAKLNFTAINDRFHSISVPYEGTFGWILDAPIQGSQRQETANFMSWLGSTDGQNMFWITGVYS